MPNDPYLLLPPFVGIILGVAVGWYATKKRPDLRNRLMYIILGAVLAMLFNYLIVFIVKGSI